MPNSDYAPGLPEKGAYGDLSQLTPGQLVTYALQEHRTKRSKGRSHYDLRLGTPDTGLFSWAVPQARLPLPKEKLLAIRTELHRHGYGQFQGTLGPGYGQGQVRRADYGEAVIHSHTPRSVQFTIAHAKVPTRYRLMHIKEDQWLLFNTTPQGVENMPQMKPSFKLLTEAELPNALEHAKEVQAKIDGALGVFHVDPKGKMEAYSPRRRVTGEPIAYTERMGLGQQTYPELGDTIMRGEVYGEKQAVKKALLELNEMLKEAQQVIPFNELSGLMNANLNKAIPAMQARKIALKAALFDVVRYKGEDVSQQPYEQRLAILRNIVGQLPKDKFTMPESATTPEEMQALIARIRAGQHPMTQEGVVIDSKYKYKVRPDATGYIVGTFPGTGKRQSTAGGILYTDKPGGTKPVGKIGTGFTDAELQEIVSGLGNVMGRPFRFTHRGQTSSGNYREPSFQGWETDKPDVKVASDPDGSFVAGTKLSIEKEYDPSKKINTIAGQKVVTVDGNSIKLKNDMDFVEGGNDQAYDYVPKGQVWIDKAINPKERKFIVLHELLEQRLMRNRGMSYDKAHAKANVVEKKYRQEVKKALLELGAMLKESTMSKKVPMDTVPLAICGPDGVVKETLATEMADTKPKQAKGMMGRKDLPEKQAMLFTSTGPFWMKGVNFDLDLIFLDKSGCVTSFGTMKQGSPSLYYPDPAAKLALEVRAGTCQKLALQPGDRVKVASQPVP